MAAVLEKAIELGRLIGQSDEYQALRRAHEGVRDEESLRGRMDELTRLAQQLEDAVARDEEPPAETMAQYNELLGTIQTNAEYQRVVAAQSNFDKLMLKVDEQIREGIKTGAASRIITLG